MIKRRSNQNSDVQDNMTVDDDDSKVMRKGQDQIEERFWRNISVVLALLVFLLSAVIFLSRTNISKVNDNSVRHLVAVDSIGCFKMVSSFHNQIGRLGSHWQTKGSELTHNSAKKQNYAEGKQSRRGAKVGVVVVRPTQTKLTTNHRKESAKEKNRVETTKTDDQSEKKLQLLIWLRKISQFLR